MCKFVNKTVFTKTSCGERLGFTCFQPYKSSLHWEHAEIFLSKLNNNKINDGQGSKNQFIIVLFINYYHSLFITHMMTSTLLSSILPLTPHPPRISILGSDCHTPFHPPPPWNFRNFPTWLRPPWQEYFRQKYCCTILLCQR